MKERDWKYDMKTLTTKQKQQEESVGVIHVYSYKLLNEHIKFLYPKLKPLEKSIKQAMMPIPFEVYVSSMVFFSIIAGICGGIIGIIATQFTSSTNLITRDKYESFEV